ncbi:MAG: P1 family peptidase [Rubrobacter sp.]|nr:P1 family peptidase [Rubrobacter sp.]
MPGNICDVPGVRVGHAADGEGITGCTAVLFDSPAVVGVDVRGSAPGTRETDLLDPVAWVEETHALLFTGGSAFGLAAASGVVDLLEERGVGYDTRAARIPLVPAAVIYDLAIGSTAARPDAAMGYRAAAAAESDDFPRGTAGVGTGATVGKILGMERAMKGGLGSASVQLPGGTVVAALAAVNAFGDVRDPQTGRILAGPRLEDGTPGDSLELMMDAMARFGWGESTTLGLVATNARLTKPGVTRISRMAQDGLARTVYPAHTSVDGDTVFAASVPAGDEVTAFADVVGAWGARAMQEAVLDAVRSAEPLGGVPAANGP